MNRREEVHHRDARYPQMAGWWESRWVQFAVAVLAGVILALSYVRTVGGELGDFDAYYAAGWTVRHGEPLYEHAFAWRDAGFAVNFPGERPLADRYPGVNSSPFVYPSAFALAVVPLTLLPIETARVVWFTLMFGCFIAAAFVLSVIFFPARQASQQLAMSLALAATLVVFQPTRASLSNGQVDAVLLLLISLSLLAFVRKQDARAGVWLALAASVKPFLGFLVLYYLWKGAARTVLAVIGLAGAILLLPAHYFGPSVLSDFATVALYWSSQSFAVSPFNQSPYGLMLRVFTPNAFTVPLVEAPVLALVARGAITVGVLGVLMQMVSRSRSLPATHLGLEYGLTVVGMLLVAPLAQDIYYIHLVVPLIAVAATLRASWSWQLQPLALAAGTAATSLYLSLPGLRALSMGYYAFHDAPLVGLRVLQTGAHAYGLIALAAMTWATVVWRRAALARQHDLSAVRAPDEPQRVGRAGDLNRNGHLPASAAAFTPSNWSAP